MKRNVVVFGDIVGFLSRGKETIKGITYKKPDSDAFIK